MVQFFKAPNICVQEIGVGQFVTYWFQLKSFQAKNPNCSFVTEKINAGRNPEPNLPLGVCKTTAVLFYNDEGVS